MKENTSDDNGCWYLNSNQWQPFLRALVADPVIFVLLISTFFLASCYGTKDDAGQSTAESGLSVSIEAGEILPSLLDGKELPNPVDEDETTEVIDVIKAGLFKPSKSAIQGRTFRGQTIAVPNFRVYMRTSSIEYYPCSDCHEGEPVNDTERELEEEHEDIVLDHGQGRFWCITCHGSESKDTLTSLKRVDIDFNQAFVLCGQCHFQRQKDWYFGAHGKRVGAWRDPNSIPTTYDKLAVEDREMIGTWLGERVVFSCTACHDPHSPSIKPFEPSPVPEVRAGLHRVAEGEGRHAAVWEVLGTSTRGE